MTAQRLGCRLDDQGTRGFWNEQGDFFPFTDSAPALCPIRPSVTAAGLSGWDVKLVTYFLPSCAEATNAWSYI
jgi:hypothetical protein